MKRSVNFRLEDLPPHLRSQAERQIAADNARRLKSPLRKPTEKHPIRIPKKRTPNGTEERWVKDHPGDWHYEALSFACPSGKYTPDWIQFEAHGIVAVEVKGSYRFGSQSGAAAKFKECAALYPQVHWIWAKWNGNRWGCEEAGRESIRTEAPGRPADSPHVRPCACARNAEGRTELEALFDNLRTAMKDIETKLELKWKKASCLTSCL